MAEGCGCAMFGGHLNFVGSLRLFQLSFPLRRPCAIGRCCNAIKQESNCRRNCRQLHNEHSAQNVPAKFHEISFKYGRHRTRSLPALRLVGRRVDIQCWRNCAGGRHAPPIVYLGKRRVGHIPTELHIVAVVFPWICRSTAILPAADDVVLLCHGCSSDV